MSTKLSENYSGIVINQNQTIDTLILPANYDNYIQEFHLPSNYRRGTESGELRYPALSGLQLMVEIEVGYARYAAFDYALQYQTFGLGWTTVTEGVAIGAPNDGLTWMTAYFDPVEVDLEKANARWRIVFGSNRPQGNTSDPKNVVVEYANGEANVLGTKVVVNLVISEPYHFTHDSKPAFLYLDPADNQVYFSYEQGIKRFVITSPNPLAAPYSDRAWDNFGFVLEGNNDGGGAFMFRVLALTADDGIDFLGNEYRSAVSQNDASNISTASGSDPDAYWLSKPSPSKFAVESLYFDMRKTHVRYDGSSVEETVVADDPVVVDRVLVDPVTPGVYFNVYYTEEGGLGTHEEEWENKLWTRIPQTYRMERKETHVFPEPIKARFLKIEFSHLQARHYAPGNFQQPIRYKKHPKWVLDFFLARLQTDNVFLAERVSVVYDAIDLGYNYYLDDLGQEPQTTIDVSDTIVSELSSFLHNRNDASDRVDPTTLEKINLALAPYRDHPALRGPASTLLGEYARQTVDPNQDYSVESSRSTATPTADVSSLNRDRVVIEQNYPVMFFYLTCRHKYREVEALFSYDRAYFVGVRQIAFLRDNYMTAFDTSMYIEPAADTQNIERNEF